jgi:hypothetical protein
MDLPFLNVKNTNLLEDVRYLTGDFGDIHHISAVMLLKLKLLIDAIQIRLTREVIARRLPPELWRRVELCVIRSPASSQWAGKAV